MKMMKLMKLMKKLSPSSANDDATATDADNHHEHAPYPSQGLYSSKLLPIGSVKKHDALNLKVCDIEIQERDPKPSSCGLMKRVVSPGGELVEGNDNTSSGTTGGEYPMEVRHRS